MTIDNLTKKEKEYIASLKALMIRYGVTLVKEGELMFTDDEDGYHNTNGISLSLSDIQKLINA